MKFQPASAFVGSASAYRLLPLRFRRLPWDPARVFVSSAAGDWLTCRHEELVQLLNGDLPVDSALMQDLQARHIVAGPLDTLTLSPLLSQLRTRKGYLEGGPALHIIVVSLRCHHSCSYCQVSRQDTLKRQFDLQETLNAQLVERLFQWPSPTLTIEFQGGEPLLNFKQVKALTELIQARNRSEGRALRFVIASTLHGITDTELEFFGTHGFELSTSLDGPAWLHNANRPTPTRDSYERTIAGIHKARAALGHDCVSALTTLTAKSLTAPEAIIDEYRQQGFHSISLRPLSPYGFARKTAGRIGYTMRDFLAFYRRALDTIIQVNQDGFALEETHASLLLTQLLTPFSHGYVDLRSPMGAGVGAVVYDYDGRVYPSDEARMLAAQGEDRFCLGTLDQPVHEWLASPAMQELQAGGVAEALPGCSDCAYVPLCGADPVDHFARQGEVVGHRPTSDFCTKQMGMFDLLLERIENAPPAERRILEGWAIGARQIAPVMEPVH
ncbi:His-Xaa-Ser system radical SAM maturase HxsB [Pseudoxanthomonas sp. PXM03]|uniref:His-Xaa-Ser system radical SAM maturase HxsB n=1 Tax=Pseudoxanthomonas sp. PXM03 TaxID=2769284 RepID=UPI001784DB13|nr:His-Xaa-Ser system radical SAM maturase HxsB [Pseudoxanthomonas sp. PXM03]